MSVTELRGVDGYDGEPTTPGFDRQPPQDLVAEQCVLGAMLLSKDAIADVVEVLRPGDFYKPAHQTVYDVVLDLYGRGDPADAITVSNALQTRGEIARIGGAPYLHTLLASVPTAANAGYYAKIVRERAILRRLVEAGTRIVQMGYAADGGEADELVDRAQAEVYSVTERRSSEDYLALSEIMEGTLDEIEAISSRGGAMVGVPTGFSDLDQLTNGLHGGQMIVLAARPAVGKALALDTVLPTPSGWTTMGEVAVGDELIGADGQPTRVVAATDMMLGRPCYEVTFSDGTAIVADGEHQWVTETRASRRSAQQAKAGTNRYRNQRTFPEVRTTREIAETLRCEVADQRLNHSVLTAGALQLPERALPLPPYVLGAWLGDGSSAAAQITSADPELVTYLEAELDDSGAVLDLALAALGVLGDKHIPQAYLRGSERQRRDLLAGLLDTDGTVSRSGSVQIAVTSLRLAQGIRELVLSLGYRCGWSSKRVNGRTEASSIAYLVSFMSDQDVFRLERKKLAHKERDRRRFTRRGSRFISDVRPIESVPVRCVQVDNADHLYLAGPTMIPTHNSTLALDVCRSASIKHGLTSVIFSLEMGRNEITMRLLSAEAKVALHKMRSGQLGETDWNHLARTMSAVSEAPLFIDDSPNMSMMEIRAKCRRLKQRHDLRLVVIDYLQLMSSGKKVESRQQEVSEFSRSLKLLAKELDVPVIAVSQLNRGPEQRTDKKPLMSDLRESGCLTAETKILRADTGAETTLGELHDSGARDVPVWALDDSLRYVRRHLTHVFPTGVRPVFRLTLASGKEVRATDNHPFLTLDGWRQLGDLHVGSRIAAPRHVCAPERVSVWHDDEVVMLSRTLIEFVPEEVFSLPKRQIALFLRHLWATDGSVTVTAGGGGGRVYYASTSRRLIDEVSLLLLRFGITARVRTVPQGRYRPGYTLDVSGCDDQRRFLAEIGVHGSRGVAAERLLAIVRDTKSNPNVDTVPSRVWDQVRGILVRQSATSSRQRLGAVAAVLDSADLEVLATNDVFWDQIVSLEPDGVEQVYDATVLGTHNFIANGIAVHNSIEQDADMVILLHREDQYEKESPRAGEADFIVAKHRNGPTATVTVAFQGHYSRFVDMAQI